MDIIPSITEIFKSEVDSGKLFILDKLTQQKDRLNKQVLTTKRTLLDPFNRRLDRLLEARDELDRRMKPVKDEIANKMHEFHSVFVDVYHIPEALLRDVEVIRENNGEFVFETDDGVMIDTRDIEGVSIRNGVRESIKKTRRAIVEHVAKALWSVDSHTERKNGTTYEYFVKFIKLLDTKDTFLLSVVTNVQFDLITKMTSQNVDTYIYGRELYSTVEYATEDLVPTTYWLSGRSLNVLTPRSLDILTPRSDIVRGKTHNVYKCSDEYVSLILLAGHSQNGNLNYEDYPFLMPYYQGKVNPLFAVTTPQILKSIMICSCTTIDYNDALTYSSFSKRKFEYDYHAGIKSNFDYHLSYEGKLGDDMIIMTVDEYFKLFTDDEIMDALNYFDHKNLIDYYTYITSLGQRDGNWWWRQCNG